MLPDAEEGHLAAARFDDAHGRDGVGVAPDKAIGLPGLPLVGVRLEQDPTIIRDLANKVTLIFAVT